jgi:hypothetical protein
LLNFRKLSRREQVHRELDPKKCANAITNNSPHAQITSGQSQSHRIRPRRHWIHARLVEGTLPAIQGILSKFPMLYGLIRAHDYVRDPSISFCAVGDVNRDAAPLQVSPFQEGK